MQQKACDTKVTYESIRNACEQFSKHLGIECSVSNGWLWYFCNQHRLCDIQVRIEAGSVDTADAEVYQVQLNELRKKDFLCPKYTMPMKLAYFGTPWIIILRQGRMKKYQEGRI